jgi:homoserine O-acetyltransferase
MDEYSTGGGTSVGVVSPQFFEHNAPFTFRSGQTLPKFTLIYETYGTLNASRSNAVFICHALSGDHHVAGVYADVPKSRGWWDNAIGPGKPIDTNRFFVVCCNNLGGCSGSTGPTTINPETNRPYGSDFPLVTVSDWVNSQALLADHLGIERWAAVVGGSLGGMQAMQWALSFPNRLDHAVVIAAAPRLSTQNIAFNNIARRAILTDPNFANGHFYEEGKRPVDGLILARMLGHVTYLSDAALKKKFDRAQTSVSTATLGKTHFEKEFEVERYLDYKGTQFASTFDANTYVLMTKALDYFDPASEYDHDIVKMFSHVSAEFFVVSFTSDWRFSPARSREIVNALVKNHKRVSYLEVEAPHGHDGFLMDVPVYMRGLSNYMNQIALRIS